MKQIRGIRNNNPGNIRRGSSWKGLVPFLVDPSNNQRYYDKQFCQFESMELGVRALIVLLRTYYYKHKLRTIEKIILRYAPLSENNSYSYINFVTSYCQRFYDDEFKHSFQYTGSNPTFPYKDSVLCLFFNPKCPSLVCRSIIKAICQQECGYLLSDEILSSAIKLL